MYWSELAEKAEKPRYVRKRSETIGICVHQTGRGVLKSSYDPVDRAVQIYTRQGAPFAHYVIGGEGRIVQVAPDDSVAWHAGITRAQRALYKSGKWKRKVGKRIAQCWQETFPEAENPLDLVEDQDPNEVYVSIELVPQRDATFTETQYFKLRDLILDIWNRFEELPRWQDWLGNPHMLFWDKMRRQGRLVGHEDVEPLERTNIRGGWDPGFLARTGFLAATRRFDWDLLLHYLSMESRRRSGT